MITHYKNTLLISRALTIARNNPTKQVLLFTPVLQILRLGEVNTLPIATKLGNAEPDLEVKSVGVRAHLTILLPTSLKVIHHFLGTESHGHLAPSLIVFNNSPDQRL